MNGLPYYKAYPRDFFEGTIGMAFDLKAAYRLVLDLIYMQGGKLPDDAKYIAGHLGCSVRAWNGYRQALLDMSKICADLGIISNFRADKELVALTSFQDKQRENARQPRKNNTLALAMAEPTDKPKASHTEPDTERKKRETIVSPKERGSRLSPDWQLPPDWSAWATSEGLNNPQADGDKFRDYWIGAAGAKGVKLDWQATWRNWVRKAVADQATRPKAIHPTHGEYRDGPMPDPKEGDEKISPSGRRLKYSGWQHQWFYAEDWKPEP